LSKSLPQIVKITIFRHPKFNVCYFKQGPKDFSAKNAIFPLSESKNSVNFVKLR